MILKTVQGEDNIPEGAVKLSREEALHLQKNIVETWPAIQDVFFLRFGRYITTAIAFVSSAASINVFHSLLKFGIGTFTVVLPAVAVPTGLIYYKTEKVFTNEILTLKMDCPLCHHLKFLAFQTYAGLIFPGVWGLLNTHIGHNVQYSSTDAREYWKKSFKIGQESNWVFRNVFLVQVLFSFFMPYVQHNEIVKLLEKLNKISDAYESGQVL